MLLYNVKAIFDYSKRRYTCHILSGALGELRIYNAQGDTLVVRKGQRVGTLERTNGKNEEIDVTKPHFYNLIKTAIQCLEAEERNQIIKEKDQLIAEQRQLSHSKNEQIRNLRQQIAILQKTISQFSTEQQEQLATLQASLLAKEAEIERRETEIQSLQSQIKKSSLSYDANKVGKKIEALIGSNVWQSISESSRTNLILANMNYRITKKRDVFSDYTEAGTRLGLVVETEVVAPFFEALYNFLVQSANKQERTFEIGGLQLRGQQSHTIGQLPRLIAKQWKRFIPAEFDKPEWDFKDRDALLFEYQPRDQISEFDRQVIRKFIQQWEHPAATWLAQGEQAASILDQLGHLRNRAAHLTPLYEWHFMEFWSLVLDSWGLLSGIYGCKEQKAKESAQSHQLTLQGHQLIEGRSRCRKLNSQSASIF